MLSDKEKKGRPVRSYVIRSGRITNSQRHAIDKLWNDHVVPYSGGLLDLRKIFNNRLPITVEIGFGMGSSLIDMARKESKTNFLGIEVHKPGIGKTLNDVELYAIKNLKLICHDATEVFQNAFKNKSLDRILIYFPDPWPKKKARKAAPYTNRIRHNNLRKIENRRASAPLNGLETLCRPYGQCLGKSTPPRKRDCTKFILGTSKTTRDKIREKR